MLYLVRRNYRHNGRVFTTGDKVEIAVLDSTMQINLRCGKIVPYIKKIKAVEKEIIIDNKKTITKKEGKGNK